MQRAAMQMCRYAEGLYRYLDRYAGAQCAGSFRDESRGGGESRMRWSRDLRLVWPNAVSAQKYDYEVYIQFVKPGQNGIVHLRQCMSRESMAV